MLENNEQMPAPSEDSHHSHAALAHSIYSYDTIDDMLTSANRPIFLMLQRLLLLCRAVHKAVSVLPLAFGSSVGAGGPTFLRVPFPGYASTKRLSSSGFIQTGNRG